MTGVALPEEIPSPLAPDTRPGYRIEVTTRPGAGDKAGQQLVAAAHQLGLTQLATCEISRLFFVQGSLSLTQAEQLSRELLADPVTEQFVVHALPVTLPAPAGTHRIDVTWLPGVTDPAGDNLVRAGQLLGLAGLRRAATGHSYLLHGPLDAAALAHLAAGLFSNPVVQQFTIDRPIAPPFFTRQPADDTIERVPLRQASDARLAAISRERRLALDLAEMQAIRAYFQAEQRDPTDAELEMLAQTWSEHCVHKTFKATIDYTGPDGQTSQIAGLLNTYIRAATQAVNKPWVRSAFVDNAGIVAFNEQFDLAFKVETHNHPSALEPFGGANTGVGGVVRDVLGVSARPIANTDILCFGPPDLPEAELPAGVLHPRRVAEGVVHGVEDYGNKMGIPTVNGAILYHPGYTANPLVYCGCLGLLPHGAHPTGARPGDLIIAIGGRTGRDGLRGATFSSMEMDQNTSEIAGTAVQIGNPIIEKQVQEVVLRARDEQLYTAITDCGAGGFSSAVGEMGEKVGARVQLQDVPLKYPGLRPWEIWLSEAQERMVLAVPPPHWPRLQAICAGQDVEAFCLGEFEPTGRMRIFYGAQLVGDLSMAFLHDGLPVRHLQAQWPPPTPDPAPAARHTPSPAEALRQLLALPNIRSKEAVVRRYDHEVQGGAAVKPLVGAANHGPGNAAVLCPLDVQLATPAARRPAGVQGVALGNGICPAFGELDPYAMAWAAIDEALRNVVAVGADPDTVAILDNFCWGNPNLPDRLGGLVRCAQGCYDAAVAYGTPFISGKDSLNNEYTGADGEKHAIPGTLLISALGLVPDVTHTTTMDLKRPGNWLIVVGDTRPELGGSHYRQLVPGHGKLPRPVPDAPLRFRALHQAIRAGLVQACHDCSEGGLAVALAEMSLAGRLGATVDLATLPSEHILSDEALLFAESLSRFVVEVRPEDAPAFEALLTGVPYACIGLVSGEPTLHVNRSGQPLLTAPIAELEIAWRGHLAPRPGLPPHDSRRTIQASPPTPLTHAPRILILHANGTNRDRDAALACELAGGAPEIVHINQLLAGERALHDYQMLVIPGGFSYGDDLGAGVLWATDLRHRLWAQVAAFAAQGRPVLGICNGFQALVKAGLLPGRAAPDAPRDVTLTYNEAAHFECRWVYLQPNAHSPSLFTRGLTEPIYCPVAHGEGRLAVRDAAVAAQLQADGLVALTYLGEGYPANPNGSVLNIAGLCNPAGNVLGLMPHPEDHIFPWQHPRRHRGERGLSGLALFANGLANC